ncbi:hypothetical protein [Aquella oligotrophica]|uniref:DUF4760 domain-containing protein n=1 Tax=Aquella oligotrophica TaxID=2067065 RepID=A0A2I7N946_9NEIS|nr:hypothetical protein [Aquella oligotrophica]AUR52980.1 hypothetical protein CUN60_11980 [Aquella oligotrophica]
MSNYLCSVDWNIWGTWVGSIATLITGGGVMWIAYRQLKLERKDRQISEALRFQEYYLQLVNMHTQFMEHFGTCTYYNRDIPNTQIITMDPSYLQKMLGTLSSFEILQSKIELWLPDDLSNASGDLFKEVKEIMNKIAHEAATLFDIQNTITKLPRLKDAINIVYKQYASKYKNIIIPA